MPELLLAAWRIDWEPVGRRWLELGGAAEQPQPEPSHDVRSSGIDIRPAEHEPDWIVDRVSLSPAAAAAGAGAEAGGIPLECLAGVSSPAEVPEVEEERLTR